MTASHRFLAGQTCLVTGGAQGVGWALCQALADHGATVFACDSSDENLSAASAQLSTQPWASAVHLAQRDVTDRAAFEGWIKDAHAQTGRVDVLINNAAFICWKEVAVMSVEDAERTMRVGYDGMVYGTKAVLPLMQAAGRGHIVNMGSSAGRILTSPVSAAYAATKAAIDAYSQILRLELEGSPIAVTLVRPAAIAGTDFFRKHVRSSQMPRATDFLPHLTPPEVALGIVEVLSDRRPVLDMPDFLPPLYLIHSLAPGLLRWAMKIGGAARRDYGSVPWRYQPKKRG
jgi:NAD(P)-dependent dehydrogenase (short-subunit alcohol dehydrogenase family)